MRSQGPIFAVAVAALFCNGAHCFQTSKRHPASMLKHKSVTTSVFFSNYRSIQSFPSTASSLHVTETSSDTQTPQKLNAKQLDFTLGYLNKHHRDALGLFAETFSELGEIKARKNSWSGGTYAIESAKIIDIDTQTMTLEASINERNKEIQVETVTVDLGTT